MENKDFTKIPLMDLFEHILSSGEAESIIELIRKERGAEKKIESKSEELENRQSVLNKLLSSKGKKKK